MPPLRYSTRDHQPAIDEYRKAIELKPDSFVALANLGCVHLELGQWKDAVALLKRAAELSPDSADIHDFLGAAYFKSGDREKAIEELSHVQRLKPEFQGELHKLLD